MLLPARACIQIHDVYIKSGADLESSRTNLHEAAFRARCIDKSHNKKRLGPIYTAQSGREDKSKMQSGKQEFLKRQRDLSFDVITWHGRPQREWRVSGSSF